MQIIGLCIWLLSQALGFALPAMPCGCGLPAHESFRKPIGATGPVALVNPFRFSTKYCDDETGHYYYGYRYYSTTTGRWLSRDPIGESGGLNLFAFCGNDPANNADPLGLDNIGYRPLCFNSQVYNNAPITLSINIYLPLAPPVFRAANPNAPNPLINPEPPRINDSTIKNPHYIETDWSNASIEFGGNDPVFDLPRVIAINLLGGIVQGLLSPARYVDAFDKRLSTQEQNEAFREATIGTALYVLPIACKRLLPCEALAAESGVWSLGPGPRGLAIESQLGGNLPAGFRVIDRFENGVATSIKSIDLNAATYQNAQALGSRLNGYVDSLAGWTGQTTPYGRVVIQPGEVTARTLQIAVPPGSMSAAQQAVFNAAAQRAQGAGINFIVTPVP